MLKIKKVIPIILILIIILSLMPLKSMAVNGDIKDYNDISTLESKYGYGQLVSTDDTKIEIIESNSTLYKDAEDEQPTGTLILNKKLMIKDDVDTLINGTTDLSKIKFKLIAKENILDMADGSIIYSAKQEVGTYNLDKEGNLKVENLPMGNYQLQEISTLEGFVLDEKLYDIRFDMKNVVNKVCEVKKELTNDMTVVEFSKTDVAGQKELKGAKLSVLDETGKVIDSWISTDKVHKIQGLAVGKNFILREEIAPKTFVKATDVNFTVENKKIQKVTMIDKIVEVVKTDFATGKELEGAELEVIEKDTNKTVDKWVSTKTPHRVSNLQENKTYVLKERVCPYGYEQAEEIEFTVDENKETQKVEMKDKPILTDVQLVKIDSDTKEVIKAKFKFGIYEDKECNKLIKEVKSDRKQGTVTFTDMRYGTFYIKELQAPHNYQLSDKVVKIEINQKGTFADGVLIKENGNKVCSFEFENKQMPKVKTGNETNYFLLGSLAVISLIGIIGGIIVLRKKHNER